MTGEHRGSERSLYDRLQASEHAEAREYLDLLLAKGETYESICALANHSGLFEGIKRLVPQDLTRYRQRKARVEMRAEVMALIESEDEALLSAAARYPEGAISKYLRKTLAEAAVQRFDQGLEGLDAIEISREAARHAGVAQVDEKLDIDRRKLQLEEQRLELQRKQGDLERDRFQIAADAWRFILSWFTQREPRGADLLTSRSEELLNDLESWMAEQA